MWKGAETEQYSQAISRKIPPPACLSSLCPPNSPTALFFPQPSLCSYLPWQAPTCFPVPPSAAWPPCSFAARPIRLPSRRKRGPPPYLKKRNAKKSRKLSPRAPHKMGLQLLYHFHIFSISLEINKMFDEISKSTRFRCIQPTRRWVKLTLNTKNNNCSE